VRGLAAVFGREVRDRRLLLGMALLLGLVPPLLPFLPGVSSSDASTLRVASATMLALTASLALALLLGATGVAGDLFAGRMSFYFSRPLPAWTIWGGKLAAMLVLVALSTLLIALPALVLDILSPAGSFHAPVDRPSVLAWSFGLLGWTLGVLFLLLAAHFTAVSIRSRSPWLVLDLAGLGVVGLGCAAIWRSSLSLGLGAVDPLRRFGLDAIPLVVWWLLAAFGLLVLLALLAASAFQLAFGRTDPRRCHRMQSLTLWGVLVPGLALVAGLSSAAFRVAPRDLVDIELVTPAPRGPWLALTGYARWRPGFFPIVLVDIGTGRFFQVRSARSTGGGFPASFSEDGRRAYWLEPQGRSPESPLELKILDLAAPGAQPRATGALFPGAERRTRGVQLSPDGRRAASWGERRLTVEDLATHSLLLARDLGDEKGDFLFGALRFEGPDRLAFSLVDQAWREASAERKGGPASGVPDGSMWTRVRSFDVDLKKGAAEPLPPIESALRPELWESSPDGERSVLLDRGDRDAELYDRRRGRLLARIPGNISFVRFVPGGLLLDRSGEDGRQVVLLDRDGRRERARLPVPRQAALAVRQGEAQEPLEIYVKGLPWAYRPGTISVWNGWRIDAGRGTFEPLPQRRLFLLGAGAAWNEGEMRRAEGIATFNPFVRESRIYLFPPRGARAAGRRIAQGPR